MSLIKYWKDFPNDWWNYFKTPNKDTRKIFIKKHADKWILFMLIFLALFFYSGIRKFNL